MPVPSRKIKYQSTAEARKRRQARWKRNPDEPRISSLSSFLGRMRVRSQEEVARRLVITRQRVQQIERNALWKIRQRLGIDI
jgi:DNA-directed RNA polymerase sigma subunit (sigma70/sigma32)